MSSRERLLDAAVAVIRRQGLHATTIEQLCEHAGVTKGGFFHHFASKEALAVAAAEHWGSTTGAMFAAADFHRAESPIDRIMAYLDLRVALVGADPAEFSCLAGTMVQEAYGVPVVRDACAGAIFDHAATLEADFDAALAELDPPPPGISGAGLARFTQTVLQGSFILAKAAADPSLVLEGLHHLRRYVSCLFIPHQGAHP